MASEGPAATITPTINSSQSTLTVAMTVNGATATAQAPGSLSDSYSGSLTANLLNTTLTFSGGSTILANAATTAYQPPLGGANTEGSPQNYGGYFSSISVLGTSFSSDADLRGMDLDITGGSVALGGPANGLTFTTESGATNFSVPNLPALGVTAGYYSQNLSGSAATNASTLPVTLTVAGSTETLTIPVDLTYSFSEDGIPASVRVTGNLVASAVALSGGTWTASGNGSWAKASNWSSNPAVPSSGTATFAGASAPIMLTLDGNQSAGALLFNLSSTNGYTLSQGTGGGALTLGTTAAGAAIAVLSGTQTISAPIVLAGSLAVSASAGASLQLGNISQGTTPAALGLSGDGKLILSGSDTYSGGTIVEAGMLIVTTANALAAGTSLTVGAEAASIFDSSQAASSIAVSPNAAAVPEPSSFALLGIGAIGLVGYGLRRRRFASSTKRPAVFNQ